MFWALVLFLGTVAVSSPAKAHDSLPPFRLLGQVACWVVDPPSGWSLHGDSKSPNKAPTVYQVSTGLPGHSLPKSISPPQGSANDPCMTQSQLPFHGLYRSARCSISQRRRPAAPTVSPTALTPPCLIPEQTGDWSLCQDITRLSAMDQTLRTPQETVEQLMAEAPDAAWLRAVIDALDQHLRVRPLIRLQEVWGLSDAEAARMFDISRQTLSRWREHGIPPKHMSALADLSIATDALAHYVKRERIPALVRRQAHNLGNCSLYELACAGRYSEIRAAVAKMFDLHRALA